MSCCTMTLPDFDCSDKADYSTIKDAIDEMVTKVPDQRKFIKLIQKKARIESISYAGNGWYDAHGDFTDYHTKGSFKWCIRYYYNDVINTTDSKFSAYKPQIFTHLC